MPAFPSEQRVAVVGPGALGSLLAAGLTRAGIPATLIDHNPERALSLTEQGIHVQVVDSDGEGDSWKSQVPVITPNIRPDDPPSDRLGPFDVLFICTKAHQTKDAVETVLSLSTPQTVWVTLQNGWGNVQALSQSVHPMRIIVGVTALGATIESPGEIRWAGRGSTLLAPYQSGDVEVLEKVAEWLNMAGFEGAPADDWMSLVWGKLAVNCLVNPLTGILNCSNGTLIDLPGIQPLMKSILEEVAAVGSAMGVEVNTSEALQRTLDVCHRTAENCSSMRADLEAGRKTEIDALNGAIVRLGTEAGVDTPVNNTLVRLVRLAEAREHLGDVTLSEHPILSQVGTT